jgi:hypothetical protein
MRNIATRNEYYTAMYAPRGVAKTEGVCREVPLNTT